MTEFVSGSLFIRTNGGGAQSVDPGTVIKGHTHNFDHTLICFNGAWKVTKADTVIVREGPFFLLIEADQHHTIEYLSKNTAKGISWCVWSHRKPDGEVCEAWTGWEDAYAAKEIADV